MAKRKDTEERIFTMPETDIQNLREGLLERMEIATASTEDVRELFEAIVACIRVAVHDHPVQYVLRDVSQKLFALLDTMDTMQNNLEADGLVHQREREESERVLAGVRDQLERQCVASETMRQLHASHGGMAGTIVRWVHALVQRLDALLEELKAKPARRKRIRR